MLEVDYAHILSSSGQMQVCYYWNGGVSGNYFADLYIVFCGSVFPSLVWQKQRDTRMQTVQRTPMNRMNFLVL